MALGGPERRHLVACRSSCMWQLPRATRSSRKRQLQSFVSEFCALSFDLVDPSEQAALTRRMLAFLLYLEDSLPYWDSSSTRQPRRLEEKAYRLLGISDEDMWAIERLSNGAGKHMEANRYRAAYEELCAARLHLTAAPRHAAAPESEGQTLDDRDNPQHFEDILQVQLHRVCSKDQPCSPAPELSCAADFAEASTTDELSDRDTEAEQPHVFVFEDILQAQLHRESCDADFAEASTTDELSDDTEAEQPHVFVFEERAGKLESNDTRLVKRRVLPLGDFAFILLPKRRSQRRRCSGFRMARGLCHVQVKMCEGAAADVELRIFLGDGERPIVLRHDFSQSPTCEIEEVVDLRKLVDAEKETFSVHFSLISRAN